MSYRSERPVTRTATESHQVDFRGHLRLPEDAGTGIPVLLRLDDIFVVISSGDDELGTWRADDVVIERIFSNQFAIELDGESMVFVAQDALGFAYDGISAIEDLQERLTKRRVFKRSKKKPKPAESASETVAEPSEEAVPQKAPVAETADAPTDEPVEDPVLAVEPSPIWSPPTASAPTPTGAVPAPDFEVSAPEPVKRRVEAETSDPRPDDVRVSYPQPSTPPPPAVEAFTPPATPAPEADTAPSPAPQEAAVPAEPPPTPREEPDLVESSEAPEFEIEEVSAAATGATWADDVAVEVEADEPEIEIEEYVVPSAGAADMFTAPPPEISDEVAEEPAALTTPEQRDEPEPETEVPDSEQPAAATRSAAEGRHVADEEDVARSDADTSTADRSEEDAGVEEAVVSNGHRKSVKGGTGEQDSAKRERRHSLFGRSRDKKVPPHDHQYGEPKTIGGLTRQVCEVCGHVTFSGEDVYQGW